MVTPADWICVQLTDTEIKEARRVAVLRQGHARERGFRRKGMGSIETDTIGRLGELAVARYEHSPLDSDWTWAADIRRGHDVAGWQVRCRSKPHYGLVLNPGDTGNYLLALAHDLPRIWLAGWIDAETGHHLATSRNDHDYVWHLVDPSHLHPLPEQNGYTRRGDPWLIDPQTLFWCEICHIRHPIIEHRECRSA